MNFLFSMIHIPEQILTKQIKHSPWNLMPAKIKRTTIIALINEGEMGNSQYLLRTSSH